MLASLPLHEQFLELCQWVHFGGPWRILFHLPDLHLPQLLVFIEYFWLVVQFDRELEHFSHIVNIETLLDCVPFNDLVLLLLGLVAQHLGY